MESPEALTKWKKFAKKMKWFEECSSGNLYYPGKHEREFWLSDFLYGRAHVSMKQADKLLQKFANGEINMLQGPLQFQNMCQLHDVLDIAANVNVVSP